MSNVYRLVSALLQYECLVRIYIFAIYYFILIVANLSECVADVNVTVRFCDMYEVAGYNG